MARALLSISPVALPTCSTTFLLTLTAAQQKDGIHMTIINASFRVAVVASMMLAWGCSSATRVNEEGVDAVGEALMLPRLAVLTNQQTPFSFQFKAKEGSLKAN
jgi:hypothetical protein